MTNERPVPPWADSIPEGAFISYDPTYPTGSYFDRFKADHASGLKYYFFDPTGYGFPVKNGYPLLIFFHGASNALVGDLCINYSGAEMFSSDDYQKTLGGAYILVPVADEYRDEEGVKGTWDETYIERVMNLIDDFTDKYMTGCGKKILLGNSCGGRFTFKLASRYPDKFDLIVPVGSSEIPDDSVLDVFDEKGLMLFLADGKRDEITHFDVNIAPRIPRLKKMRKVFIFTPDWVYNGDKGIASINFGFEMGQHCLMNGIQSNLMFDDKTPMDPRLPEGLTGWIRDNVIS